MKTVEKTLQSMVPDFKTNASISKYGPQVFSLMDFKYQYTVQEYYEKYLKLDGKSLLDSAGGVPRDVALKASRAAMDRINTSFNLKLPANYLERITTKGRWDLSFDEASTLTKSAADAVGLTQVVEFAVQQSATALGISAASQTLLTTIGDRAGPYVQAAMEVGTVTLSAVSDGEVTRDEARAIGATVGGAVGAIVGAYFGPAGSAICGAVCSAIGDAWGGFFADVSGQTDKELKRERAYFRDVQNAILFYEHKDTSKGRIDYCEAASAAYFKLLDAYYDQFYLLWEELEVTLGWRFDIRFTGSWIGPYKKLVAYGTYANRPKPQITNTSFASEGDRISKLLGKDGIWAIDYGQSYVCADPYGCPFPTFDTGIFKGAGPKPKEAISDTQDRVTQAFLQVGIPYIPRSVRYATVKSAINHYQREEYDNWKALHPVHPGEKRPGNIYPKRPEIQEVQTPTYCQILHNTVYTYAQIADTKNQHYFAGKTWSDLSKPSASIPKLSELASRYETLKRYLLQTASAVRGQQEAWLRGATFQDRGFDGDAITRAISLSKSRSSNIGNIMLVGGAGALAYALSRK